MNDSDIIRIFKLGNETDLPKAYIAKIFNISIHTVYKITSRESYADITRGLVINKVKNDKNKISVNNTIDDSILNNILG